MSLFKQIAELFSDKNVSLEISSEDLELVENLSQDDQPSSELAICVLLVDLALIDGNFEARESEFLYNALIRLGLSEQEISNLIQQSKNLITSFRGPHSFANFLKSEYPLEKRKEIADLLNKMIIADEKKDGFEVYLLNKLTDILEV